MSQGANRVILRIFRDTEAQIPQGFAWGRTWKNSGGAKSEFFFEKKIMFGNDPKRLPASSKPLFRQNWTNYTPIWAHFVACMMEFSCILAIPCSENSVFLEKKNWSQKASQNMQKASHIIKVPQCPFPNHIFTAAHTCFTRILACAACPIIYLLMLSLILLF